jgi:hypothetical protein
MASTIQYNATPSNALTLGSSPQVMEELEGSPREAVRNDGLIVTREFKVPYGARLDTWAGAMLARGNVSGTTYSITKPMEYTHAPADGQGNALGRVRVSQVDFRPFGDRVQSAGASGNETCAGYDWALATVTYRPLDAIVEELQIGGEFATLGSTGLHWDTSDTPPPALTEREAPGLLITQALWSVTRRWLPGVPPEYLTSLGTVNPADLSSPRYGVTFAAGTLLYQAPVIRGYADRSGNALYDVTARCVYRPSGWNKYWHSRDKAWQGILRPDPTNPQSYIDASLYAPAPSAAAFAVLCQYQGSDL